MKKIVYVIIGLMTVVLLVSLSATDVTSTLKVEDGDKIVEFNPIY